MDILDGITVADGTLAIISCLLGALVARSGAFCGPILIFWPCADHVITIALADILALVFFVVGAANVFEVGRRGSRGGGRRGGRRHR